jgi:hypothetical protein
VSVLRRLGVEATQQQADYRLEGVEVLLVVPTTVEVVAE